jgi:hypothetical protein
MADRSNRRRRLPVCSRLFTGFDDPATGDPIEEYSAADSVVIGLTYLIGTAYSGPTVSTVEMTFTGAS